MTEDAEARRVANRYRAADPAGERTGKVIRHTFDQIYDGRHTGRYRLDQLSKTEKTHIGSLIEINLRREFDDLFSDGELLDFSVDGVEIDCKYSKDFGGWMIPPEAWGKLLLVCTADDAKSEWSIGVVRATEDRMNSGNNRDAKRTLKRVVMNDVDWIHAGADLPENILLHIDRELADQILSHSSGQKRINDLLRSVTGRPIGRGTIETVAQQDDPMKRLRTNGGASSHLAQEGILVIGGTYESHRMIARDLGAQVPTRSETISLPIVPAEADTPDSVLLGGEHWRLARQDEPRLISAPPLPATSKK